MGKQGGRQGGVGCKGQARSGGSERGSASTSCLVGLPACPACGSHPRPSPHLNQLILLGDLCLCLVQAHVAGLQLGGAVAAGGVLLLAAALVLVLQGRRGRAGSGGWRRHQWQAGQVQLGSPAAMGTASGGRSGTQPQLKTALFGTHLPLGSGSLGGGCSSLLGGQVLLAGGQRGLSGGQALLGGAAGRAGRRKGR